MNGQIARCKGVNEGKELEYSIRKLMEYLPNVESVSVVPVGLSRYREGLYPLEPFNAQDAGEIIDLIEKYQKICMEKYGTHFIQASDEWYILAGREGPEEERYDGYLQLENGVGMIRLLLDEFHDGLKRRTAEKEAGKKPSWEGTREISLATGRLAFPYLKKMSEEMMSEYPGLQIHVYEVINEFFGELITVSGLLYQHLNISILWQKLIIKNVFDLCIIYGQYFISGSDLQFLRDASRLYCFYNMFFFLHSNSPNHLSPIHCTRNSLTCH